MTFHTGMAKRFIMLSALSLVVPVTMWATSSRDVAAYASQTCISAPGNVCITSGGGTAAGGTTGLVLDGITPGSVTSTVTAVGGLPATGTLAFTTGALISGSLISGSLSTGGVFAPGTLTVNVISWDNFSGVLFRGTFGDPRAGVTWAFTGITGTGSNRRWNYTLTGRVGGAWYTGATVSGSTAQLFFSSKTAYNGGPITLASTTASRLTPEPASIGLLGTGLLLMGFIVRRRAKRDR